MSWTLLRNSFLVSTLATLLAAGLGLAAALCLAGLERRWRNALLGTAILALALPPFLITNCWLDLLGDTGAWRPWLHLNIMSLGGAVWILALLLWPISLLLAWGALSQLEAAQLESDLAVGGWALFRGLLLPMAWRAVGLAAMLTFVLALNNFTVPVILQVQVFPEELWVKFNTTFDTVAALRLSIPLVAAPLILLSGFRRYEFSWPRVQGTVPARLLRRHLGAGWWVASAVAAALVCGLSVGLPIYQILAAKRTWVELAGALAAGRAAIWTSLWYAGGAASLIVGAALLAGPRARLRAVSWLAWLPFLVPGVLLGIGLIAVFNRPLFAAFYQSAGIVVLAFVLRYFALGRNAVSQALRAVDADLTDAARLDGASRWQMLRHVWWPQISAQTAAAWYVVFLLCLWDVESMILTVPPGGETLALRIFNLLHYGHNAQVNALCLTLLVLAVSPLLLGQAWQLLCAARARASQ
jgi:iron(III) transport system permease protein